MLNDTVAIAYCDKYDKQLIKDKLSELMQVIDGFSNIKAGMHVGIKANLVAAFCVDF